MAALVFVELSEGRIKKSSLEAVAYAHQLSGAPVTAVVTGSASDSELSSLGGYGVAKVLHCADARFDDGQVTAGASVLAAAMQKESAQTLVLAGSSLATPMSARTAVKINAGLVTGVTELPSGNTFKRSIFTGKAFAKVSLSTEKKIIVLKKNAAEVMTTGGAAVVEKFSPSIPDTDFRAKVTSKEKASGTILLPEAEVVVSGGRGMKGPEHWSMLEELASVLNAATGCSKPVSDLGWRPHHEHVGQTGIKVAPQLYLAIGISGAIQHLAGVNGSKCIVVINKDPDCPFFKAADYGIVGDAFEVVPRLITALREAK
jgi:electron transfer flavoprotein alpha subunit